MLENNKECEIDCPIAICAQIIEGKWTSLIFRELYDGKKRYSQLQRALKNVSPRMLALRLRFLESKKLIIRKVYPTNPPTTEYELTQLGESIKPLLFAMSQFGEILKAAQ